MRQRKPVTHSADILFVLGLVCLFGVCSLLVVLFGGRVYQHIVENSNRTDQQRTAFSYISNKLRSADGDEIKLLEGDGMQILRLTEALESGEYQTYLYYYDGAVRELTLKKGEIFNPASGEWVVNASGLSFTQEGQLLTYILLDADNQSMSCSMLLRAAG